MNIRTKIKKGRHYPFYLPFALPFRVKKNGISIRNKKILFTSSCMYDLHDEDQLDVNKLFGFSIGHHHKGSSFRFGWRPILKNYTIEIVAYEYRDGIRQKTMPICEIDLYGWYNYRIEYNSETQTSHYTITDADGNKKHFVCTMKIKKTFGWGYTLGLYFGGNRRAPQDIVIFKK